MGKRLSENAPPLTKKDWRLCGLLTTCSSSFYCRGLVSEADGIHLSSVNNRVCNKVYHRH